MYSISTYFKILRGIYQKKSLCRILQNFEAEKITIAGKVIEFGAHPFSKNNFSNIAKKKRIKIIHYSDKNIKYKNVINVDLNKKINLKKNYYDTVIFFNVMEHLINPYNANKEIYKIMKRKGVLIGSTPFLYRFHAAPSDYLRFTKPFLTIFFKKNFRSIKIKNLGFGPFCLSYSFLSDFTKKIPFLNLLLFSIAYFFDFILNLLTKYDLKDIYPIAIYFKVNK